MNSEIDKHFKNSLFYKNYHDINHVFLKFKNIKNQYNCSKNKYKNELIRIISMLEKNKLKDDQIRCYILFLFYKYGEFDLDEKLNTSVSKNVYDDFFIKKSHSCKKILNEKINIEHDIKKYINYIRNIHEFFMEHIESRNIKNIKFLFKIGFNIICNLNSGIITEIQHDNIKPIHIILKKGIYLYTYDDNPFRYYGNNEDFKIINFNIEKKDNVTLHDDEIMMIREKIYIRIIEILIGKGVGHIFKNNNEAYLYAIERKYIGIVKYFKDKMFQNIYQH